MGQLDSTGYFELKDISFPDSTLFIVHAAGENGRRTFVPYIDEDSFAPILDYYRRGDSTRSDDRFGQELMQRYYDIGGERIYQLNPVYVTAKRKIKPVNNPSPISSYMFKKGQLREGRELEPYKNYDLITYISETFPGLRIAHNHEGERILLARATRIATGMGVRSSWLPVVVYINGIEAFSVLELNYYTVDELSAIAYVSGPDAAPFVPAGVNMSQRGVVMLQTKLNKISGMPKSITKGTPLGWQKPAKFYSPTYEHNAQNHTPAGMDKRSTVYWNPALNVPKDGKSSFEFYTSDGSSPYTVVIEGLTADGDYIFKKETISRHNPKK